MCVVVDPKVMKWSNKAQYVYVYVIDIYIYIYAPTYIHMCICTYSICTYSICTYSMCIYTCMYISICINVCTCIHAYMHSCMHTYVHTYVQASYTATLWSLWIAQPPFFKRPPSVPHSVYQGAAALKEIDSSKTGLSEFVSGLSFSRLFSTGTNRPVLGCSVFGSWLSEFVLSSVLQMAGRPSRTLHIAPYNLGLLGLICIHIYTGLYTCKGYVHAYIYICTYAYMNMQTVNIHMIQNINIVWDTTWLCLYMCMSVTYACNDARMFVRMYVRTYACMYVRTYVHMYVDNFVCMYVCEYLCKYVCIFGIHMCICLLAYVYAYKDVMGLVLMLLDFGDCFIFFLGQGFHVEGLLDRAFDVDL